MVARRIAWCVPVALVIAQAPVASAARAQDVVEPPHRTSRRIALAITGTVLGALAGLAIDRAGGSSGRGGCFGIRCVVVASTLGGAAAGYLVGREFDRRYAERYRGGVGPLHIGNVAASLTGTPAALAVSGDLAAVAGSGGIEVFAADSSLRAQALRAGGLRGLARIAVADGSGWLAAGSPDGLYVFPPDTGRGMLASEGDVSALAAANGVAYGAIGNRIDIVALGRDSARTRAGALLPAPIRAVAFEPARALLWVGTDRDLRAFRADGDTLAALGSAPLAAPALAIAVSRDTVAVAMGAEGVELFDVRDAAAPRTISRWSLARFAYDVSLDAGRLFVAAGPEGVYVISLRGERPRTLGLARELGFAWAIASSQGYTYILDRQNDSLRRILSDF